MSSAPLTQPPFRFSSFEADPQSGELRKNGVRLRIQDQPFQILLKLLERPGQVVTREELKAALWSADTFVDFDNGLNMAVKRLREVLADDADLPRFIETLPRRGYRFIAAVQSSNLAIEAPPPSSSQRGLTLGNPTAGCSGLAALPFRCRGNRRLDQPAFSPADSTGRRFGSNHEGRQTQGGLHLQVGERW